MTDLQRVEIAGFKGIERLEFEPSGVNLVTGRNNTGKTSLLEAIALVFDPTYVEEFGEDVDSLIHRDFEECRISVETEEGTREMTIRHPTEEEATRYFASAVTTYVMENANVEAVVDGEPHTLLASFGNEEALEYLADTVSSVARHVVRTYLDDAPSDDLLKNCLLFVTETGDFPCVVFDDVTATLIDESVDQLVEEPDGGFGEEGDIVVNRVSWSRTAHLHSRNQPHTSIDFLDEPPVHDETTFVKTKNLLAAPDFDPDSGDAIKRDDLGDYIGETGLLDELKTFNLDELVFQKEAGEKYSVPYDFMGDGFKTIVGLLWELMDDEIEDQIVLLEEPENHMHPGYVRKVVYFLVELAKDEGVQLFVTTHNKDFIDTFFTENLTDEEVEFLEEEFTLVRMESESAVVEDYEIARENVEDLHLDLRGI